MDRSIWI